MSTLLLATTGGHLAELAALADRLPADPDDPAGRHAVWVTHANAQSTSLLSGRDVEYVPYIGVRDLAGVLRAVRHAHRLLTRRRRAGRPLRRVVSTGSGIALGYLPYLAARGLECHFVESAARPSGPSLTGRLLRRVPGVHTYTRYASWADAHWRDIGNDVDRFRAVERPDLPPAAVRVVVTLGTAGEYPFPRLLEALAPLLADGGDLARATGRPVRVLWQVGGTPVPARGLPGRVVEHLGGPEFTDAVGAADLVVGHAGLGTAMAALTAGRVPVLVPRSRRHGEAGDDHQRDLLTELGRRDLTVAAEIDELGVEVLLRALHAAVEPGVEPPELALCTRGPRRAARPTADQPDLEPAP